MVLLSKSKFLIGYQCEKYLWTVLNHKELLPELTEADMKKFEEGTKVGELAKKLYPDGIDIPESDFKGNLIKSRELIKEGKVLFEAGFIVELGNDSIYSRADILVPVNDSWDIIEVKSGTSVKDINVVDVAFQKYVYEQAGLKINNCYLLHINNEFVKDGEIDVSKFFVKEDISSRVGDYDVGEMVKKMLSCSKEGFVGAHCKKPYECPLLFDCTKSFPEHNVLHLYRGGKKSYGLIENEVYALEDVSDIKLTGNQAIQVECAKNKSIHVEKEKIQKWLEGLKYPLYYLDFETFSSAIPLLDGTKPYAQVCFQFSLHVDESLEQGSRKVEHYEYLAGKGFDCRKEFFEELKKVLGNEGDIIVYNKSFEIARIRELGELFSEDVSCYIDRVVDLLDVFRNFWYYNPVQKGSASIKKVLPAVTEKDYSSLDINNGALACLKFLEKGDDEKVRSDLLKYCCLDTEGMVWIIEKLREMVK